MVRSLFFTLVLSITVVFSYSQYYFRGDLKDEQGNGLQGARIILFSKGAYPYFTGTGGVFGIPSGLKTDTVTFIMPAYDTLRIPVSTLKYGSFFLKAARKKANTSLFLSSYTKSYPYSTEDREGENDKNRSAYVENPFIPASPYPKTLLGLHVDKAGYSNIRRMLNIREKPSEDEVKIEGILNYFNLKTIEADQQKTFTFNSQITDCPWNEQNRLLFINLVAKKISLDKTPQANLVFLIDVSGSMDVINRLPLIKSAFKLFTENLRPTDKVSIVTYGDAVTALLTATSGADKQKIIESIEGLRPNGSTPGASAIRTAYAKARENFIPNGNNRIILATDGDFNVGETNFKGLTELAGRQSKEGIYMSCLGVGIDKDENLEALAKAGQGKLAYLDDESGAEKVLIEEFAQTLYTVAVNVLLNIQFNAGEVKDYRLIGFDNRKSAVEAKITDIYGGEAGSGQSMMAAFEFTPSGNGAAPVANVRLDYQQPGNKQNFSEEYAVKQNYKPLAGLDSTWRFATSILAFGEMLKQSPYYKDYRWGDVEELAESAISPDDLLQKEFVEMIIKARKIYPARRSR